MRRLTIAAAAGALALALSASVASAAILVTADQGLMGNGGAVPASRSDTAAVTDGDVNTFYSLGIGGSLTASITGNIATASVLEVTLGNNASFPESARIFLGESDTGTLLGEIFNDASGGTNTSSNGATITATANTPSNGITSFLIDLGGNTGSALTFVDTTGDNFSVAGTTKDGFDIGELSITPVPLPMSGLVLLTAIGGVAVAYRRKPRNVA